MKKRILIQTLLLFFAFNLALLETKGCTCGSGTPQENLMVASIVFSGKVTKISNRNVLNPIEEFPYYRIDTVIVNKFEIDKVWKGNIKKGIEILTSYNSCSYQFEENKEYVVYAFFNNKGNLITDGCSGNFSVECSSQTIDMLGFSYDPIKYSSINTNFIFSFVFVSIMFIVLYFIILNKTIKVCSTPKEF